LQEKAMTGVRSNAYPYGEIPADSPRRRRKSLRHRFSEGIEAAVKAEPKAFTTTRPRTMMGLMVRELVCAAASARCDAVKLVITYLDEGELRRTEAEIAGIDNSQGISEPESPPEPKWDWSEDGAWDASEREPHCSAEEAQAARARTEALRAELREKFLRAAEADRINAERKARLEAEREGSNGVPETHPAPISGNIPPAPMPDPHAGTRRIGGRLVEG
jgi:hypothetical protein